MDSLQTHKTVKEIFAQPANIKGNRERAIVNKKNAILTVGRILFLLARTQCVHACMKNLAQKLLVQIVAVAKAKSYKMERNSVRPISLFSAVLGETTKSLSPFGGL